MTSREDVLRAFAEIVEMVDAGETDQVILHASLLKQTLGLLAEPIDGTTTGATIGGARPNYAADPLGFSVTAVHRARELVSDVISFSNMGAQASAKTSLEFAIRLLQNE